MESNDDQKIIPTLDLKTETKEVKGKAVQVPWMVITTSYLILSDGNVKRRIWTKDKWKIVLYYLYRITRIEFFIKKYNQRARKKINNKIHNV
jgi:hypothetical protein